MFRRYQPRGAKLSFEGDSVRVSNQMLAFSYEVWKECFDKSEKISLFFEEETNQIGMKGDAVGTVISDVQPGGYKIVRWAGFIRAIKFSFEIPITKKISKQGDLWVIEGTKIPEGDH